MEIFKELKLVLWLGWEAMLWLLDVTFSFIWVLFISTLQFFAIILPLGIVGLLVVPIGIMRPDDSKKDATLVTVNGKKWWRRTFKDKWLKWWDNPIDGSLGDDDLRWGGRDIDFGVDHLSFLGQYMWCALRNPVHYFKQFVLCCDIRNCVYEHLSGSLYVRDRLDGRGFQLARAKNTKGFFNFYRLYWVAKYPFCNRGIVVEMGYEFRKDHWDVKYEGQEYKAFKGTTWIINPFKPLR